MLIFGNQDSGQSFPVSSRHRKKAILAVEFQNITGEQFAISSRLQHWVPFVYVVRKLLSGSKYAIDYYQREYRWQPKQVQELIDDLVEKFLESYDAAHERSDVEKYGHYFLGSIIISDRDGQKIIIDGQQRLTTLTLLLVYLHNLLDDADQQGQLAPRLRLHDVRHLTTR